MRHIAVVVASAGLLVVLYACSDISDYTDPTANTTPPALALQHGPAPEVHVAMPATSPAAPASQPTTNRLPPTVLILPFQNLSQGHEGDWAGNSIQQTLAGDVTRTRTMAVLAPVPSSGLIPESPVTDAPSAAHAGEQLHAPYVVFGTYEIVGQDLRINAHVVDTHSAQVMGSLRATGTTAQMFLLQDMLTDQLRIVLRKTSPVGSEQAVSDLYPGPGTAPSTTGPGGMAPYDTTAELPYSEPYMGPDYYPYGYAGSSYAPPAAARGNYTYPYGTYPQMYPYSYPNYYRYSYSYWPPYYSSFPDYWQFHVRFFNGDFDLRRHGRFNDPRFNNPGFVPMPHDVRSPRAAPGARGGSPGARGMGPDARGMPPGARGGPRR